MSIHYAWVASVLLFATCGANAQPPEAIDLDDITMNVVEEGAFKARDLGQPDMDAVRELMRQRQLPRMNSDELSDEQKSNWLDLKEARKNGDVEATKELRNFFELNFRDLKPLEENLDWRPDSGNIPEFFRDGPGLDALFENEPLDEAFKGEEFRELFELFGDLDDDFGQKNGADIQEFRSLIEEGNLEALIELLEQLKEEADENKDD